MRTRFHFLGYAFAVAALTAPTRSESEAPNILFIMADDHSAATVGCYATHLKAVVQTPNIDRLAAEGARFTNVQCVNSLCAPSRATIITGLYSHRNGVFTLREDLNTADLPTVPKLLRKAGYQTAVIGKWHLHGDNLHGFDYHAVTTSQGSYMNPSLAATSGKKLRFKGHSTEVYTDHSIDWLKQRDKTRPFFLMTHFKAAHGPWHYAPRYQSLYEGVVIPEPPTLFDTFLGRHPNGVPRKGARLHKAGSKSSLSLWFSSNRKGKGGSTWPTGTMNVDGLSDEETVRATYQKYAKDYLRCVKGIDDGVGRLRDYLESEGILDNTVIVYTSDQGMFVGESGFYDKRLGLNPAMQMPLILRFPKAVKKGVVFDELINNVDYAKTLLAMGEVAKPASMQGYSFWNLARGKGSWKRTRSVYQFYSNGAPKHYGLVTSDYKLLKYVGKDGSVAGADLFDRRADPTEQKSLTGDPAHAGTLMRMERELVEERKLIGLSDSLLPGRWRSAKATLKD
ncbi:MAG: sulfatase [Roseibacillus sp.]